MATDNTLPQERTTDDEILISGHSKVSMTLAQWEKFQNALIPLNEFCEAEGFKIIVTEFTVNMNEGEKKPDFTDLEKEHRNGC